MPGPGWNVTAFPNGKWLARAWDPNNKKFRNKRWPTEGSATAWAKAESARLRTGESQAGKSPVADLITDYITDITRRGSAPIYIAEQKRVLNDAVAHGVTDFRHPRVDVHARDWLKDAKTVHKNRKGRPLSPRTRNRYLESLRTLANYGIAQKKIRDNPFLGIKPERIPSTIKATFRLEELAKLVALERRNDPYWLIFNVLAYTGCRIGEALNLRWEWFDWNAKRIVVRNWADIDGANTKYRFKFNKERVIPLQPELADALCKQPDKDEKIVGRVVPAVGWVIPDAMRKLSPKGNSGQFAAYVRGCLQVQKLPVSNDKPEASEIDIVGNRTPHSTRHTWISLMLASGENQLLVQGYAGHAELETTAGYAKTQELYRDAVKSWQRGELHLRPSVCAIVVPAAEPSSEVR